MLLSGKEKKIDSFIPIVGLVDIVIDFLLSIQNFYSLYIQLLQLIIHFRKIIFFLYL